MDAVLPIRRRFYWYESLMMLFPLLVDGSGTRVATHAGYPTSSEISKRASFWHTMYRQQISIYKMKEILQVVTRNTTPSTEYLVDG